MDFPSFPPKLRPLLRKTRTLSRAYDATNASACVSQKERDRRWARYTKQKVALEAACTEHGVSVRDAMAAVNAP